MPIDIHVEGLEKLEQAGAVAAGERGRFRANLALAANTFGLDAVGWAKRDYLSGPRPQKLGVVTGRLRASIAQVTIQEGDDIETQVGSNVVYARAQEMGFDGTVRVPAHVRMISKVFGRSVSEHPVQVRTHSRKVHLEPRAFLEPSINDALPGFEESIGRLMADIQIGGD